MVNAGILVHVDDVERGGRMLRRFTTAADELFVAIDAAEELLLHRSSVSTALQRSTPHRSAPSSLQRSDPRIGRSMFSQRRRRNGWNSRRR
jgi:hypothetical protein